MKKLLVIYLLIASISFAQDMRQNAFTSLFADHKAARVGDAITIVVMESSQASNNAQTSAGRESDLGFGANGTMDQSAVVPNVDLSVGSKNNFRGSGETKTSGMIRTKISATIDSVLANGNMVIRGSRKIIINEEEQTIFIKGIVRSSDIDANNTVYSYNISEAEIRLEGSGMIHRSQEPGWLTKFFHWIF